VKIGDTIYYFLDKNIDPYFIPILNYELINYNLLYINELGMLKIKQLQMTNPFLIETKKLNTLKVSYTNKLNINEFSLIEFN
jgi:hypothetical protein